MSRVFLPGGRPFHPADISMAVTGGHKALGAFQLAPGSKIPAPAELVSNRLNSLHGRLGSWKAVSDELGGLDRAMLCRVAAGKQSAPRSVRVALRPQGIQDAADWLGRRVKKEMLK